MGARDTHPVVCLYSSHPVPGETVPCWWANIVCTVPEPAGDIEVRVRPEVSKEELIARLQVLTKQLQDGFYTHVDPRDYFRGDGRHTAIVRATFDGFTLSSEADEREDAARLRAMADYVEERGLTLEMMEAFTEAAAEAGGEVTILRSAITELRGVPLTPDQLAGLLRKAADDLIDAVEYLASPAEDDGV